MRIFASVIIAAALVFGATSASAATDARLCAAKKNIAAGRYFRCMTKAEAKFDINQGIGIRIRAKRKCSERLERFYSRASERFGANCATPSDPAILEADLASIVGEVTQWLRTNDSDSPIPPDVTCGANTVYDSVSRTCTGSPVLPPNNCGNGEIDSGEECDFQSFGGATCSDYGFARGNLACASGCVIDAADCYDDGNPSGENRFEVLIDGTVRDKHLNLIWESKFDLERGPISERNLRFTTGGIHSVFLKVLNDTFSGDGSAPLGGCSPWRLPTSGELVSVATSGMFKAQCGGPIELCLPGGSYTYWSSTNVEADFVGVSMQTGMTKIIPNSAKESAIGVCDPS